MQVFVRDNNVDQALRALKKKMQREGIFREMKRRPRHRPLSFRAWEAVNKLKADLAYRTPSGRPMKHVVLRRDLAAALLVTIQGMLRRQ